TNKKVLKEGGNVFKYTQRINLEDIPDTLQYISKISNIPLATIKDNVLGSVGKAKTSGDIDIAVCSNTYDLDSLAKVLKKHLGEDNVRINTAFNIVHTVVPIISNKEKTDGFVQVDFMLTDNVDWAKFNFFSA